jgi:hypothetical protein
MAIIPRLHAPVSALYNPVMTVEWELISKHIENPRFGGEVLGGVCADRAYGGGWES